MRMLKMKGRDYNINLKTTIHEQSNLAPMENKMIG